MNFTDANVRRAFVALRSLGECIVIERLALALAAAEKQNGRELTEEELKQLALRVHENTTGAKIGFFTLDQDRLDVDRFHPPRGVE